MYNGETERTQGSAKMLFCILIGTGVSFVVCLLFLMMASAAISFGWIGEELMNQLTVAACVLGSFTGGMAAVKRSSDRRLPVAILTGALLFALLLLIGALAYNVTEIGKNGVILMLGCLCGGALSGLLCKSHTPKRKRAGEGRVKRRKR